MFIVNYLTKKSVCWGKNKLLLYEKSQKAFLSAMQREFGVPYFELSNSNFIMTIFMKTNKAHILNIRKSNDIGPLGFTSSANISW